MRDRTKAARAVMRSEIYRGALHSGTKGPGADAVPSRPVAGGATPRQRKGSRAPSQLTALALLGLLDLFKGG